MLLAAAAVSLGPLALWLLSRTAGLPFGPEPGAAESIGLPDLAACALEIVAMLAAVTLLRRRGRPGQPATSAHTRSLVVLALVAVTVSGVAAVGLPLVRRLRCRRRSIDDENGALSPRRRLPGAVRPGGSVSLIWPHRDGVIWPHWLGVLLAV